MKETTLKYIATKIKQLKEEPENSTILFLGAGVSKTAGIPLAKEIVNDIEKHPVYKNLIKEGTPKTYTRYMNCLSSGDRKKLFKSYIDKAKINMSHLYAAQLVDQGYIDYIVTTNFDPLMIKSLGLFNIVPSIYDLAITKDIVTAGFQTPAIIYFHGQSHGFWQLNTDDELELPVNAIKDTINKISINRAWIVVGYSGSDPVFKQLSGIDNFTEGLYWVGYEENTPSSNVMEKLLNIPTNGSLYLKGYNSDSFFRSLRNELKLDEPKIISKPFTHLLQAIENITTIKIDNRELDLCSETREQIKKAIRGFENKEGFEDMEVSKDIINKEDLLKKVKEIFNNEKYDDLTLIEDSIINSNDPEIMKYYSYVLYNWGTALLNLAKTKQGKEAEELFKQSFEKFKKATEIKKDKYEAFYNWGIALSDLAETKQGKEAEELFKQSFEKFKKATEIKKDFHEAFNNWGTALSDLAKTKQGEEADELFKQSFENFKKATETKKDIHTAFNNWGNALLNLAKIKQGKEADELFKESIIKLENAENILKGSGSYNLACVYSLLQDKEKALIWFEKSLILKDISIEHIEKDTDLDNIRKDQKFIEFLDKYRNFKN